MMLTAAVGHELGRTDDDQRFWARFKQLLAALRPADPEAARELDRLVHFHANDVLDFAALLGYGLGRTAQAGLEHQDGWLDRAKALADPPERLRS